MGGVILEIHSMDFPPKIHGNSLIKYVSSCANSSLVFLNSLTWSIGFVFPLYLSNFGISQCFGNEIMLRFLLKGYGKISSKEYFLVVPPCISLIFPCSALIYWVRALRSFKGVSVFFRIFFNFICIIVRGKFSTLVCQ